MTLINPLVCLLFVFVLFVSCFYPQNPPPTSAEDREDRDRTSTLAKVCFAFTCVPTVILMVLLLTITAVFYCLMYVLYMVACMWFYILKAIVTSHYSQGFENLAHLFKQSKQNTMKFFKKAETLCKGCCHKVYSVLFTVPFRASSYCVIGTVYLFSGLMLVVSVITTISLVISGFLACIAIIVVIGVCMSCRKCLEELNSDSD